MGEDNALRILHLINSQASIMDKLLLVMKQFEATQETIKQAITDLSIAYLRLAENVKTSPIPAKLPNCS